MTEDVVRATLSEGLEETHVAAATPEAAAKPETMAAPFTAATQPALLAS